MNSQASNLTCVALSIFTRRFATSEKKQKVCEALERRTGSFLIEAELFKDTYWTLEGVDFLEGC
jgi:hypothetical protein